VIKSYYISYTENINRMTDCCNNDNIGAGCKTLSSHNAIVIDDVSKLGYTSVIFLDLGIMELINVTCF